MAKGSGGVRLSGPQIGYDSERRKSSRALEAERDGYQKTAGFLKSNGMEEDVLKHLSSPYIGVVDKEWHHTGLYFNKTDYLKWADGGFKEIYKAKKSQVDELVKNYDKKIKALGAEPAFSNPNFDRYHIALNEIRDKEFPQLADKVKKIFKG